MSLLKSCDTKCEWGSRNDILNWCSDAVTCATCTSAPSAFPAVMACYVTCSAGPSIGLCVGANQQTSCFYLE